MFQIGRFQHSTQVWLKLLSKSSRKQSNVSPLPGHLSFMAPIAVKSQSPTRRLHRPESQNETHASIIRDLSSLFLRNAPKLDARDLPVGFARPIERAEHFDELGGRLVRETFTHHILLGDGVEALAARI